MAAVGIPLGEYVRGQIYRGVLTGFNNAFVIDSATRAALIQQDARSAELIKPLTVGKDIHKWRIQDRDHWFIYSPWNLDIDEFPAIKDHLSHWRHELEARPECRDSRYNWWCMARYGSEYVDDFARPKIVWGNLSLQPAFAFEPTVSYIFAPANFISLADLYLLGILNSDVSRKFFSDVSIERSGNYLEFKPLYVKQLPIPNASASERTAIADLVQRCLDARGVGCGEWEAEIDARVARLYGLHE